MNVVMSYISLGHGHYNWKFSTWDAYDLFKRKKNLVDGCDPT